MQSGSKTLLSAGMDLLTYISDPAKRAELAVACGTSPAYLYQLATGRRRPKARLAERIEEATSGEVCKIDLIFGPAPAQQGEERADAA